MKRWSSVLMLVLVAAATVGCGCRRPSVVAPPEIVSFTVVPPKGRAAPEAASPAVRTLLDALRAQSGKATPEVGPPPTSLEELSRKVCPSLGESDPACLRSIRALPTRRLRAPRAGIEAAGAPEPPPEQFLLCLAQPRVIDPAKPLQGSLPKAMAEAGGELRPNVRYRLKAQPEPQPSRDEQEAWRLAEQYPDWAHKQIDYLGGLDTLRAKRPGQAPGEGVVVVHLDTGFTSSCQLQRLPGQPSLVLDEAHGYDYFDCRDEPKDPLVKPLAFEARQPGHGTATSSVLVSPHVPPLCNPAEPPAGEGQADRVVGIAPGATVIPVRVTDGIILGFPAKAKGLLELQGVSFDARVKALVAGIFHAIEADAAVVSISMGGVCADDEVQRRNNAELQMYMTEAEAEGIIIVAAAGQFPLPSLVRRLFFTNYPVTFPGSFPSTVSVAASTIFGTPWSRTSRGPKVDVTAPGFGVWRAEPKLDTDPLQDEIQIGQGTSFSTAITAGAAALWVQYWGRDFLKERYGPATAAAFRLALQRSAQGPKALAARLKDEPYGGAIASHVRAGQEDWNKKEYGPGLLDVARLLDVDMAAIGRDEVCRNEQRRVGKGHPDLEVHFRRICPGMSPQGH